MIVTDLDESFRIVSEVQTNETRVFFLNGRNIHQERRISRGEIETMERSVRGCDSARDDSAAETVRPWWSVERVGQQDFHGNNLLTVIFLACLPPG